MLYHSGKKIYSRLKLKFIRTWRRGEQLGVSMGVGGATPTSIGGAGNGKDTERKKKLP